MSHGRALAPEKVASRHIRWPKSKVAFVIGGAAIAGVALGAMLWIPFTGGLGTENVVPSNTVRTAEASLKNNPTQQGPTERANEINQLNSQIASLENEIEELTGETLDLNSELFQLELHIQGLEDQSTENRVVYNFVNVPIGKTVESVETPTLIAPIPVVDLPASAFTDSYSNDPIPEAVSLQGIAYDSDNGFYLNSQFAEGEYEDSEEPITSDDHQRIVYPPISSE